MLFWVGKKKKVFSTRWLLFWQCFVGFPQFPVSVSIAVVHFPIILSVAHIRMSFCFARYSICLILPHYSFRVSAAYLISGACGLGAICVFPCILVLIRIFIIRSARYSTFAT